MINIDFSRLFSRPLLKPCQLLLALLILSLSTLPAIAAEHFIAAEPNVPPMKTMGGFKVIHGEADINAPPGTVWAILTDYATIKHILPGYSRSVLLNSNGREKKVDLTLKLNPFTPELNYQVRFLEERHLNRILFERISGDFDQMSGSYKLVTLNGGHQTRLLYELQIDFGVPIPGIGYLLRGKAQADLAAIQKACAKSHLRSLANAGMGSSESREYPFSIH